MTICRVIYPFSCAQLDIHMFTVIYTYEFLFLTCWAWYKIHNLLYMYNLPNKFDDRYFCYQVFIINRRWFVRLFTEYAKNTIHFTIEKYSLRAKAPHICNEIIMKELRKLLSGKYLENKLAGVVIQTYIQLCVCAVICIKST